MKDHMYSFCFYIQIKKKKDKLQYKIAFFFTLLIELIVLVNAFVFLDIKMMKKLDYVNLPGIVSIMKMKILLKLFLLIIG